MKEEELEELKERMDAHMEDRFELEDELEPLVGQGDADDIMRSYSPREALEALERKAMELQGKRARLLRDYRKARKEGRLALAGELQKKIALIDEQLRRLKGL